MYPRLTLLVTERQQIEGDLQNNSESPLTGEQLSSNVLVPNHALRNVVQHLLAAVQDPTASRHRTKAELMLEEELAESHSSCDNWMEEALQAAEGAKKLRARVAELESQLREALQTAQKPAVTVQKPAVPVVAVPASVPAHVVKAATPKVAAAAAEGRVASKSVKKARKSQKAAADHKPAPDHQPADPAPAESKVTVRVPASIEQQKVVLRDDSILVEPSARDLEILAMRSWLSMRWWQILQIFIMICGATVMVICGSWWTSRVVITVPRVVGSDLDTFEPPALVLWLRSLRIIHVHSWDANHWAVLAIGAAGAKMAGGALLITAVLIVIGCLFLLVLLPSELSILQVTLLGLVITVTGIVGGEQAHHYLPPLLVGLAVVQSSAECIALAADAHELLPESPFAELQIAVGLLMFSFGELLEMEHCLTGFFSSIPRTDSSEAAPQQKPHNGPKPFGLWERLAVWIDCMAWSMVVTGTVSAFSAIRLHTPLECLWVLILGLVINRAGWCVAKFESCGSLFGGPPDDICVTQGVTLVAQGVYTSAVAEPCWRFGWLMITTRLPVVAIGSVWWMLQFGGHRLLETLSDPEVTYGNIAGWILATIGGLVVGSGGCYLYEQNGWASGTDFWVAAVLHIVGSGMAACAAALVVCQCWAKYLSCSVVAALDPSCSVFVLCTGLMAVAIVFNTFGGERSTWAHATDDLQKRPALYVAAGVVGLSGLLLAIFAAGMAFFVVVLGDLSHSLEMVGMLSVGLGLFFVGQQMRVDLITLSGALLIVAWGAAGLWGLALGWGWLALNQSMLNSDLIWRGPLLAMSSFIWLVCCTDAFTLTHNSICHLANLTTTITNVSKDDEPKDPFAVTTTDQESTDGMEASKDFKTKKGRAK